MLGLQDMTCWPATRGPSSHPSSLRQKKQTLLFLQETRFKTHSGDSWEERQGRGKCSELSCLEVGVGWVRKNLILTLRVSLVWSRVWSTLTVCWDIKSVCLLKGTQQRPELMFGCWFTRICRFSLAILVETTACRKRKNSPEGRCFTGNSSPKRTSALKAHTLLFPLAEARVRRKASFLVISARLAKFMGSNKAYKICLRTTRRSHLGVSLCCTGRSMEKTWLAC